MSDKSDSLNRVYDKYKDRVSGPFHNALWQIMINNSFSGAFFELNDGDLALLQRDGGYIPTGCRFNEPVGENEDVLSFMNKAVFGLEPTAVEAVIFDSLRNSQRPTGRSEVCMDEKLDYRLVEKNAVTVMEWVSALNIETTPQIKILVEHMATVMARHEVELDRIKYCHCFYATDETPKEQITSLDAISDAQGGCKISIESR